MNKKTKDRIRELAYHAGIPVKAATQIVALIEALEARVLALESKLSTR